MVSCGPPAIFSPKFTSRSVIFRKNSKPNGTSSRSMKYASLMSASSFTTNMFF